MDSIITCQEATTELAKIKTLEAEFLVQLDFSRNSFVPSLEANQAKEKLRQMKRELEQAIDALYERTNFIEREFQIKYQYERQLKVLRTVGIVEILSNGKEGIKSIEVEGRVIEYPIPTLKEVTKRMKNFEDEYGNGFLEMKKQQGFERILLVPFGMALDKLIEIYKNVLLDHHKRKKLFCTKKDPSDQDQEVNLDTNNPLYVWKEAYEHGDTEGKIVYDVQRFEEKNHGGKTKAEILKEREKQSQQGITTKDGWNVLLLEKEINIPRKGNGKKLGPDSRLRAQIEVNKSAKQYLEFLLENTKDKNSPYQGEQGLTPEEWLMLAITYLEQENQIIDDCEGSGSSSLNIGAFFPASFDVPHMYFSRSAKKAGLSYFDTEVPGSDGARRFGVRG